MGDALKQCPLQQDIRLNNPPQAIRLYGEDNDKLVLEITSLGGAINLLDIIAYHVDFDGLLNDHGFNIGTCRIG